MSTGKVVGGKIKSKRLKRKAYTDYLYKIREGMGDINLAGYKTLLIEMIQKGDEYIMELK